MVLKDFIKKGKAPIKESYYKRLAEVEASNNPNAQAKTSSAAGLYQFTKGTWNELTKQMGLEYSEDDRFDPIRSRKVVEEFTRKNKNYLMRKLGREPNEAELYLAHFQGMGGANKILTSMQEDPHARVDSIVHQKVINANKNVFLNKDGSTKEVKDIYNWAAEKFGLQGYKEEVVEDIKPSFEMEAREPVAIEHTAVRQPIFEPIKAAKFNDLFRFDNTEAKLPEYNNSQQQEVSKQEIPAYKEQQHIKYDPSLYEYIQLGEFQDGGEYNEGIEKPRKLKNQTEGEYKSSLRKYKSDLRRWNLENNPEKLPRESDEQYKDRTALFEHKRKKGRGPLRAFWEDKVKTPQEELPYLLNLVSEIITSPVDIGYYLANKIDVADIEKYKSKKIKRNDDIGFVDSLTDASSLIVPWKLPILGLSPIKHVGKALIKESGKRLIKEARQEMGFDLLQYVNENLKTPAYKEQQHIKYGPSLYEYTQLGEFQDGGEYNEEKNWLEDWYKNRAIKNDYINEAVQKDKKDISKRASIQPDIETVDSIENNVHGRYLPKENKIVLDKKATTIDVLHEYDHFLTDIPLYSRTTDLDVINKNIRSRENTQGVYKDKYDYFTSQPEIKARVMNLRREADIKPDEHVTKEKLINFLQKDYKGNNSNINDLYHLTPNVESLLEILNNTASLNQESNKNYS